MHSASLKSDVNQLHIFTYAEGGSMQMHNFYLSDDYAVIHLC